MQPCDHDSRPLYEKLIGPLRAVALELGYALLAHGSLKRDIDLVACPWTEAAVPAVALAEELRQCAAAHNHGVCFLSGREQEPWYQAGKPGHKAHGRLCWSFHLGECTLNIDAMPRHEPPCREWTGI